jgi:hypothetical protein
MVKDLLTLGVSATAGYGWLCAIIAPLVTAARSLVRRRGGDALKALALASGAAVLWTVVPLGVALLAMMLEPRYGLALLQARGLRPAFVAGMAAWLLHLALQRRMPRIGATFEAATAIAIVAAFDDAPRTLARVESLYRACASEGSRKVNSAPPDGLFEAWTSPPCRTTMARTIDSPRPLPDGMRVPAREASTL